MGRKLEENKRQVDTVKDTKDMLLNVEETATALETKIKKLDPELLSTLTENALHSALKTMENEDAMTEAHNLMQDQDFVDNLNALMETSAFRQYYDSLGAMLATPETKEEIAGLTEAFNKL